MCKSFLTPKRFFITLFFLFSIAVFSQVKSYVGIVREKYYASRVTMLEEYRDSLQSKGYTSYAKAIDSYLKGGFGSGFVYVCSYAYGFAGDNFVVDDVQKCDEFDEA